MSKEDFIHAEGRVTEILPNSKFNVLLDNGLTIRATLSGKMRKIVFYRTGRSSFR